LRDAAFYSLMQMQDGIARSYNWIHIALLPPYVVRHLVMLVLVSAAFLLHLPTTAETVVAAVAVSFAITVIGQTVVLNRKLKNTVPPGPKAYEVKAWFAISLPILMVEGCYLLLTSTDILVLQQFRSPEDVAIYYAAVKTLALITFVHFAVAAAVGHRFSEYHVTDDRKRLESILSDSIRWTFWASLAASVLILALGRPLLWLFGTKFLDGYYLMFILAVGLMARAAVGPVERLLNMLGEQRACAAVYAFAFVLNLVLCVVLIPRIGVKGAAVATSTALIVESALLFCVTRWRLGFHVFIWRRA
jgi:O-antigen/teichoic acid export membrane protein